MANEISIRCKNSGKSIRVPLGSTLREVYDHSGLNMEYGPVAARINNKVQGLNYRFYNSKDVEFLSLFEDSGMRTYSRTLFLVLAKAVEDIYPSSQLIIGAPVSHGYYFELRLGRPVEDEDVQAISYRMREIVAADMPIRRIQCPIEDAIQMFRSRGMTSKVQLLETQGSLYTYYYKLENTIDYFYGCLMTRTSQLHLFQLIKMDEGLLLRIPSQQEPWRLEEMTEQKKASQEKRRSIEGHIHLKEGVPVPQTPLLIVDDVLTSGESLKTTCALMKNHPYPVKALLVSATAKWIE